MPYLHIDMKSYNAAVFTPFICLWKNKGTKQLATQNGRNKTVLASMKLIYKSQVTNIAPEKDRQF